MTLKYMAVDKTGTQYIPKHQGASNNYDNYDNYEKKYVKLNFQTIKLNKNKLVSARNMRSNIMGEKLIRNRGSKFQH